MAMDRLVIALLVCGAALDAHGACEQPPLVQIPPPEALEGNEDQVVADTRAYFQGMKAYVDCIRAEIDSAGTDASELYLRMLVQRNNLAVAEAEAVQRWFNSRFPDSADAEPEGEPD